MKVLIVEDDDAKFEAVLAVLVASSSFKGADTSRSKSRNDALRLIHSQSFDMVIADLNIPALDGEPATDETATLVEALMTSNLNRQSALIILSAYPEIISENDDQLKASGVSVIEYSDQGDQWKQALRNTLDRIQGRLSFDFVLVAALDKECEAYKKTDAQLGDSVVLNGLECRYLDIDNLKGVSVRPPRMGLVDTSVTVALAISTFNPGCVFMSGICGGVEKEAPIGTLVIADPVWEYQAGKWADEDFKVELYQQPLDEATRRELRMVINDDHAISAMKSDLYDKEFHNADVKLGPMATGSAVIASSDRIAHISEQHRKLMAIDMEMYGVFRAVALARSSPLFFGAKTVVDTADNKKGDEYHEFGCILSARFCVEAVRRLSASGLLY